MKALTVLGLIFLFMLINIKANTPGADELIYRGKKLITEGSDKFDKALLLEGRGIFERILNDNPENDLALYYLTYSDYLLSIYSMKNEKEFFNKVIDEAIENGEKYLNKNGNSAEMLALMSTIYGIKISVDPELAQTLGPKNFSLISKALELAPDNPRVLLNAGISKFNAPSFYGGSKTEALKYFQKSVENFEKPSKKASLQPDWGHLDALAWLGMTFSALNEYEKAIEVYKKALEINPEYRWIKYQLLPDAQKNVSATK
ncbi:MAG: tetratricopeptide repeat protein [Ignavibacteriaceae bacterium]